MNKILSAIMGYIAKGHAEARDSGLEPPNQTTLRGFMCKTDYFYEFPDALCVITLYPTLEEFKDANPGCRECGYVEVEIKYVSEGDFN